MTQDDILDNLSRMTAHQIAELVRSGQTTLAFLYAEGGPDFPAAKRKEVERLLNNSEQTDWDNAVQADTEQGYQTFLNNYPTSSHCQEAREAIERLRRKANETQKQTPQPEPYQQPVDPSENAWASVNKRNKQNLRDFLAFFPYSPHAMEAQQLLYELEIGPTDMELMKQRMKDQNNAIGRVNVICEFVSSPDRDVTVNDIYEEIRKDHNWLAKDEIKGLVDVRMLNFFELSTRSNIDQDFMGYLTFPTNQSLQIDNKFREVENVPDGSTEIYFWGIPSSGKTCAIGAILSSLANATIGDYTEFDPECQGYNYMNQLSMLFRNSGGKKVFTLPTGTPLESLFVMRCDIFKDQRRYPVTFVDVSGESLKSMYMKMSGIPMDYAREGALDKLSEIVGDNTRKVTKRKIHFFVIEYDGHNRMIPLDNGTQVDQMTLLDGVKNYINQFGKVFAEATDAIYILITKSDKAGSVFQQPTLSELKNYITTYYSGFYKSLVGLCNDKKRQINKGEVKVLPFTLGDICFQSLCKFDPYTANNVINIILERAWSESVSKTSRIIGLFKK